MKKLIAELKQRRKENQKVIDAGDKKGLDNLDSEDLDVYFICTGSVETLDIIIPQLEKLNKK